MSEQDEEPEPARFTPYESPLRMFKSYRYHPNYAHDIPGGFLSLTFSHQINPEKPLCQFESAGGACNDPECPDQHFREVAITGALEEEFSILFFFFFLFLLDLGHMYAQILTGTHNR
jgi:hypothetical protein